VGDLFVKKSTIVRVNIRGGIILNIFYKTFGFKNINLNFHKCTRKYEFNSTIITPIQINNK